MGNLTLNGATSGQITISPPAVAGSNTLTLPAATGTIALSNQVLTWQSVQTANFTAVSGNAYPVNTTSGAVTVTLPASPSAGNLITILDYAGTASTNNITISPNGNKIQGGTTSVVMDINRQAFNLVYVDSTQGWLSYADETLTSLPIPYSASYLVIAGGGGGGWAYAGGGGAGGLLSGTATFTPNSV